MFKNSAEMDQKGVEIGRFCAFLGGKLYTSFSTYYRLGGSSD